MKFYLSGFHSKVVEDFIIENRCHRLLSAAYEKVIWNYLRYANNVGATGLNIIIDSGAFTAWNTGKPMTLKQLYPILDKVLDKAPQHNYIFVSLDVIPGERGRIATKDEVHTAVEQSVKNFDIMLAKYGSKVLPVFHTGEDMALLRHYYELVDYVSVSPNQNMSEQQRFNWVNNIWLEGKKFHGLATTGNKMLTGFDWYSVDSAGWLLVAAMGGIIMIVDGKMKTVSVSDQSPNLKKINSHIDNMFAREYLLDTISSKGYDIESLRTDPAERIKWNITELYAFRPKIVDQRCEGLFPI